MDGAAKAEERVCECATGDGGVCREEEGRGVEEEEDAGFGVVLLEGRDSLLDLGFDVREGVCCVWRSRRCRGWCAGRWLSRHRG